MFKVSWHPAYVLPLPGGHRFPMMKYSEIRRALLSENIITESGFSTPVMAALDDIERVHDAAYLHKLLDNRLTDKEKRLIGLPYSPELVTRERLIVEGTIKAAHFALHYGCAANIAGGTHHAFSGHGEAYCLLNDQAIAAASLIAHKLAERVLIVDLDVHQGNGTAQIFSKRNDVFTFSMHARSNYPFRKEKSDFDVELDDSTDDAKYLQILDDMLRKIFPLVKPDVVFYQAGVDVLAGDKLGKLGLSPEGLRLRDEMVFSNCHINRVPVVFTTGGGYAPQLQTIVDAHISTFNTANRIFFQK